MATTREIQAELLRVVQQHPELDKHQIITKVMTNLKILDIHRPTVRRAKAQLIDNLRMYIQVLS